MFDKFPVRSLTTALAVLLSLAGYVFLAFFMTRENFYLLLISISILFVAYLVLYNYAEERLSLKQGYALGMVFRLVFLFAVPALSDDFYRFIWDGRLLLNGINPFSYLPENFISQSDVPATIDHSLFLKLNSPNYFSVYPPFSQLIFYLASAFSGTSIILNIVWIRLFVLMAEGVTIHFLPKLLALHKMPAKAGLLYALNPLIVLELTGNLHFEAFMICFTALFLYYFSKQHILPAALFFGLAVLTKLIPLIFLPLILFRLCGRDVAKFLLVVSLFFLLAFLPFISGFPGFGESLSLYFQKFEFNGSIYFLLREIGFWIAGFNLIFWIGKVLAIIVLLLILRYSWIKRNSPQSLPYLMMWILLFYLLLATTVHPWYIAPLVFFSVFTAYRFPILWSALIILTYIQYQNAMFQENLAVIVAEYLILFIAIWYESSYQKLKYI